MSRLTPEELAMMCDVLRPPELKELVGKLRYMGKQYGAGQASRGGSPGKHYLEEAADELDKLFARTIDYGQEIADLRNVVQAACIDGLPGMAAAWEKHFPDHPISLAAPKVEQEAPAVPTTNQDRSAWLIECRQKDMNPCWLMATGSYTNNADEAFQFARELDAELFLEIFLSATVGGFTVNLFKKHLAKQNYSVTEHMWPSVAVPPISEEREALKELARLKAALCSLDFSLKRAPFNVDLRQRFIELEHAYEAVLMKALQ